MRRCCASPEATRPQRGHAGGGGERMGVMRAGVRDPPRVVGDPAKVVHHVSPAADGTPRHAAGQDLAERGEVGEHPGDLLDAAGRPPEAA